MPFIERILRLMTHLNIGAAIATAMWLFWSGFVVAATPAEALRPHPPARGFIAAHVAAVGTLYATAWGGAGRLGQRWLNLAPRATGDLR